MPRAQRKREEELDLEVDVEVLLVLARMVEDLAAIDDKL
jgi:hypothetical protein